MDDTEVVPPALMFSATAGVEGVAEGVAEEVQREEGERHGGGGKDEEPPEAAQRVDGSCAVGQQGSPAGLWGLDAEAEKT